MPAAATHSSSVASGRNPISRPTRSTTTVDGALRATLALTCPAGTAAPPTSSERKRSTIPPDHVVGDAHRRDRRAVARAQQQQAGDDVGHVLRRAGLDRPAEQVDEQQHQHDRQHQRGQQRLGVAAREAQAAAGEGQRVRHGRAPCPVRARKTSSSVASWIANDGDRVAVRVDLVEQPAHVRGAAVGGHAEREARRLAVRRARRARPRRPGTRPGPASVRSSRGPATRRLSSAAVPSATTRPPSMTAMRSASRSASSRYWVVRKTVTPSATQLARSPPTSPGAAARVEARRRLVEEEHRRAATRLSGEVEPPAHPARVGRRPAARRRRRGRSAAAGRARSAPGVARATGPASRPIMSRFSSPVCSSSTAAYWPVS